MSTRCQIMFEGTDAVLYQHSDGYCEGVLPTLLPFVKEFYDRRGEDPEYMAARLLQRLIGDDKSFTGFGVGVGLHSDIEFLYTVKSGGAVLVEAMRYGKPKGRKIAEFPLGTSPDVAIAEIKRLQEAEE